MRLTIFLLLSFVTIYSTSQEILLKTKIDSIQHLINQYSSKISSLEKESDFFKKELNRYILDQTEGETYICISGTYIYKNSNGIGNLKKLSYGNKVKVLQADDKLFKVLFKGIEGYAFRDALISEVDYAKNQLVNKEKADKKRQEQLVLLEQQKKREQDQLARQRQQKQNRKNRLIKKYGAIQGEKINNGSIWIGMSKEMVIDSRGHPSKINRSVGTWGVHEQMIYNNDVYIYIENGILASWQD
ncbi:hypothetical protein [Carboxylicivirga sp. N1Y90]|uniref:hypothetical protein n=1 Tax=Carboxylicivirga fragile TaxID=3417571 RepID=UPI003D358EA3|nr:hypothetical protein [Marinilabiliaceae bacterium N1Y90]